MTAGDIQGGLFVDAVYDAAFEQWQGLCSFILCDMSKHASAAVAAARPAEKNAR